MKPSILFPRARAIQAEFPNLQFHLSATLVAMVLSIATPAVRAQVVTDGTLGPASRLVGPNFQIPTAFGAVRGANLFHSFSQFSIGAGERAVFQGGQGTRFIIARVTGGEVSSINGPLTTAPLGASLFLINPAGIAFGPGASLNLGGSFHASTAASLRLLDGALFTSDPRLQGELTSSLPDTFIFNGPSGRISLEGSFLRAPERGTVGLHAGSLLLTQSGTQSAVITAPGGQINLTAFQGASEVQLDGTRLSGNANGNIQVLNGSLVTVSEGAQGQGGGRLVIRGGLVQVERSSLESRSRRGNGAGINVEATQALSLSGATLTSSTTGAGSAGDITLTAPQITLDASTVDGRCDTGCSDIARGANIRLAVENALMMRNNSRVLAVTRSAGRAGNITAQARDITLESGSGMDTSCDPGCGTGSAGALTVSASGTLSVRGTDTPSFLVANSFGPGNAGRVELRAATIALEGNAQVESITLQSGASPGILLDADIIRIQGGAQVVSSTQGTSSGGPVNANARGSLTIAGTRVIPGSGKVIPSGIFSNTSGRGDAGTITITAPTLQVLGGAEISSSSLAGASGNGGVVNLSIGEDLLVEGTDVSGKRSAIISNTFSNGNAGRINLSARSVVLRNSGAIFSQTESAGAAGTINIAANSLTVQSGAQIGATSFGAGAAGDIRVQLSGDLDIMGFTNPGAGTTGIYTDSTQTGAGGTLEVSARNISLNNFAFLFSSVDRAGSGGNLLLTTQGNLSLSGNSQIRGFSSGTGLAGNLTMVVGGMLNMVDSSITTSARRSDGGNISLQVAGGSMLSGSQIATEVGSGLGNGGNFQFGTASLLMRNTTISANAFGGNGGNIRIGSPLLIANAASRITASSTLGIDGTVQLDSPAIDLSALLSTPFLAYLDTTLVGSGSCLPRAAAAESRLALLSSRKAALQRLGPLSALPASAVNEAQCLMSGSSSVLRP